MTVLADRYELAETLGAGGTARVFVAYDRRLGRRVAVKLVREELVAESTTRHRLLREARAVAGLAHPNIIAVLDVGEYAGRPFVVMELVGGRSLAERLQAEGRLSAEETVRVLAEVLEGLHAAHEQGLVHRDVKPANILLADAGGVKLTDFGIAKALAEATTALTATGQILGSPRYLSPEQAGGRPVTPATDLYAVGVVAYECLTGRPPFVGESPLAVALAHRRDRVPPLTALAPHTPQALAEVVEQALAKDPAERHPSAAVLHSALRAAAATVQVAAPRTAHSAPRTTAQTLELTEPHRGRPARSGFRLPRRWLAAGLAALGALALGGLMAQQDEPGVSSAEPARPAPRADAEGGRAPEQAPQPSAGGRAVEDAAAAADEPGDLGELTALLAEDPEGAGKRAEKFVHELMRLQGEDKPDKRRDRARALFLDVSKWIAEDELDPTRGRQAVALLASEMTPDPEELAAAHALLVDVAADQTAWGEKADALLSALGDLLAEDDTEERAEDTAELVDEVREWVREGKLDHTLGGRALAVLRPLTNE